MNMKLSEICEEVRKIYAKKIEDPSSITSISPSNTEERYKVKNVIFDNKTGLGSTPNNQNVNYKGITVIMDADDFIKIAADAGETREETAAELKELIDQGYGLGTPFLELDIDDAIDNANKPITVKCVGHEGRGRVICAKKYFGITELPVHLFFLGYRNRHITPEIIDQINKGIKRERSSSVVTNAIKKVIK